MTAGVCIDALTLQGSGLSDRITIFTTDGRFVGLFSRFGQRQPSRRAAWLTGGRWSWLRYRRCRRRRRRRRQPFVVAASRSFAAWTWPAYRAADVIKKNPGAPGADGGRQDPVRRWFDRGDEGGQRDDYEVFGAWRHFTGACASHGRNVGWPRDHISSRHCVCLRC